MSKVCKVMAWSSKEQYNANQISNVMISINSFTAFSYLVCAILLFTLLKFEKV